MMRMTVRKYWSHCWSLLESLLGWAVSRVMVLPATEEDAWDELAAATAFYGAEGQPLIPVEDIWREFGLEPARPKIRYVQPCTSTNSAP